MLQNILFTEPNDGRRENTVWLDQHNNKSVTATFLLVVHSALDSAIKVLELFVDAIKTFLLFIVI
jgi:hypothetical protein